MRPSTGSESRLVFIDAWAWLVLANDREPEYPRVTALRHQHTRSRRHWVTTDYALDETMTRLFAGRPFDQAVAFCDGIFQAEQERTLTIERITAGRFHKAWQLRLRYRDKPRISFTDFTSFVVMQELGIREALTADAHFTQVQLGFRRLP